MSANFVHSDGVYMLFLSAQVKDSQTNWQIGSRSDSVSSAGKLLGVHNSQGSLHRQDFCFSAGQKNDRDPKRRRIHRGTMGRSERRQASWTSWMNTNTWHTRRYLSDCPTMSIAGQMGTKPAPETVFSDDQPAPFRWFSIWLYLSVCLQDYVLANQHTTSF